MTWNDLQRARNCLKRPTTSNTQPTMTWTYLLQAKKRRKTTNNKQIFRLFYSMGQLGLFSSLLPNIWLQSFEHYFTEDPGGSRASSIYYYGSSINYHLYFLWDIRFIFFCPGFVSAGKGRGHFFRSCLPLPPASQIVSFSAFAFIRKVYWWARTSQVDPGIVLYFVSVCNF